MSLFSEHKSVPDEKFGHVIVGRSRADQYRLFGSKVRLTWGERILGAYDRFWQVDTTERVLEWSHEAESSQTTLHFRAKFEIGYRVSDPVRVVSKQVTFESTIKGPINRFASSASKDLGPDQHRILQEVLTVELAQLSKRCPFDLTNPNVTVRPPEDFESVTSKKVREDMTDLIQAEKRARMEQILRDIDHQYELALAMNDRSLADSLGRLREERMKSNLSNYDFARKAVNDGLLDGEVFRRAAERVIGVPPSDASFHIGQDSAPKRLL